MKPFNNTATVDVTLTLSFIPYLRLDSRIA